MHLPSIFGFSDRRIVELGAPTTAIVTDVKTCWWLKVNTSHIHSSKNARYPHIIYFRYSANGLPCSGIRILNWQHNPPVPGCKFTLYYDPENPKKYAAMSF